MQFFPEGSRRWSWYVSLIHSLQRFINSFDRVAGRKTEISFRSHKLPSLHSDLKNSPLISIVVPVYNTKIVFLEKMLSSVLSQTYKKWQLVLVDDASTDRRLKSSIDRFIKDNSESYRITYIRNEKNKRIAGSQNVGIKYATVCCLSRP
jgi:cellulose synthase/poly-beta-1,6-N-acetylglucosamine synthase-like glycosyltransferase